METEILNRLYNLVLSRDIRDFERGLLLTAKQNLETGKALRATMSELEANLRPLAVRFNLTPSVAEFYDYITTTAGLARGVGKMGKLK
jgi:hypothetical protein